MNSRRLEKNKKTENGQGKILKVISFKKASINATINETKKAD